MKKVFDFALALTGLVVTFPFWFLFIFFIWLEDGRPFFYIQDRVGLNGKMFKIIKFRTLTLRDNKTLKFANFLRETALDELPQLINILKFQMSFVGPRPVKPDELEGIPAAEARLKVMPGLTGIAQLLVSKNASLEEKARYDIWYAAHQNIRLDIQLILRSFWNTLRKKWDA